MLWPGANIRIQFWKGNHTKNKPPVNGCGLLIVGFCGGNFTWSKVVGGLYVCGVGVEVNWVYPTVYGGKVMCVTYNT